MLPEELDARLLWEARRRWVPMADVVREAIEHDLAGTSAGGRIDQAASQDQVDGHMVLAKN